MIMNEADKKELQKGEWIGRREQGHGWTEGQKRKTAKGVEPVASSVRVSQESPWKLGESKDVRERKKEKEKPLVGTVSLVDSH